MRKFIGYENLINNFRNRCMNNTLSHAHLIAGEDGIGKSKLANILAKLILNGNFDREYVDIINYRSNKASFGVDDVRNIIEEVSKKPFEGDKKVIIIHEGNKLTTQAQNALLKTIEEPPVGVHIIILCESLELILDTIKSRCEIYKLTPLTKEELYEYIKSSGARNVTITGGEPLLQKDIYSLLDLLKADENLCIHIETNGAVGIRKYKERYRDSNIHFIVDYKLPASGMLHTMKEDNLHQVSKNDVYKFVISSEEDLQMAYDITQQYKLSSKCLVYFSPVVESIEPKRIVEFMIEKQLKDIRLQIQVHKVIWPKDMRGV